MNFQTRLGITTLVILGFLIFASRIFNTVFSDKQSFFNPQPNSKRTLLDPESTGLKKIVENKLKGQKGDYAVVVKQIGDKKEEHYSYQADKVIPAASLYKLFLLAAAFQEIEKGSLKEDQLISDSKDRLTQVLGAEEFGYENSGDTIEYPVSEILTRIATISDNYASVMLAEKIGWDKVQSQADKIGAKNTRIKAPISSTAGDITLFYEKLYSGEIVSKDASNKIIDLLSKSQLDSRIPNELPDSLKIAHKTGELAYLRHDAGIVFLENKPYIIVMMANNVPFEDDAEKLESELSKQIYDYFSSKN